MGIPIFGIPISAIAENVFDVSLLELLTLLNGEAAEEAERVGPQDWGESFGFGPDAVFVVA